MISKMEDKRLGKIENNEVAVFSCDIQERFRPAIKYFDDIVLVSKRIIDASTLLNIPLVVTEQYPKGLGKTVEELDISHAVGVFPKTQFTMLVPEVKELLPKLCDGNLKHVILIGIEAHVCIQQTVLDLLQRGYQVHIVADAVSSRSQMDRKYALKRFRQLGAIVTTSEAILLQLVGSKDHPQFKAIQAIIKESAPTSGL